MHRCLIATQSWVLSQLRHFYVKCSGFHPQSKTIQFKSILVVCRLQTKLSLETLQIPRASALTTTGVRKKCLEQGETLSGPGQKWGVGTLGYFHTTTNAGNAKVHCGVWLGCACSSCPMPTFFSKDALVSDFPQCFSTTAQSC